MPASAQAAARGANRWSPRRLFGARQAHAWWSRLSTGLFLLPGLVLLAIFAVGPFLYALYLSFTDTLLLAPQAARWIGWANYLRLFREPDFWNALGNTMEFVLIVVPVQTALALALAILVNQKLKGVTFFRGVFFSPVVLSMVVVSIVWTLLYNRDSGLINGFLQHLGIPPQPWLLSESQAMPSIIITSIWQGVGYQMVIFLAGLQDIPKELYEAAAIDGAGRWQQFRYVTLPGLRNVTLFVVVITTIFAFKLFTQPFIMTKGGPNGATKTIVYYMWEQGFRANLIGYSAAVAVVFFLLVLGISILQHRLGTND
ncbi:MAG: sugar ABC transporter permease [Bacillota bacterium]